jgi:hypothetical protein
MQERIMKHKRKHMTQSSCSDLKKKKITQAIYEFSFCKELVYSLIIRYFLIRVHVIYEFMFKSIFLDSVFSPYPVARLMDCNRTLRIKYMD